MIFSFSEVSGDQIIYCRELQEKLKLTHDLENDWGDMNTVSPSSEGNSKISRTLLLLLTILPLCLASSEIIQTYMTSLAGQNTGGFTVFTYTPSFYWSVMISPSHRKVASGT